MAILSKNIWIIGHFLKDRDFIGNIGMLEGMLLRQSCCIPTYLLTLPLLFLHFIQTIDLYPYLKLIVLFYPNFPLTHTYHTVLYIIRSHVLYAPPKVKGENLEKTAGPVYYTH